MNQLTAGPNTYDFGYEFDYSTWTPDTVVTLVNVPWNSDYRDIVRFTSQSQLDGWIDRKPNLKRTNMSLQKFDTDVLVDTPINRAMQFNYLRATNGPSPVGDVRRNYYYFVTGVQFISSNTTRLRLQLDVWQTFGYEVTFGNSYIERGHIGIANENAFNHYGRDYLTVPEGLDIGNEYRIIYTEREDIMRTDVNTDDPLAFDVLICSTLDLTASPGTPDNPQITSAMGQTFQGMPSGANFYVFKNSAMFSAWLAIMSIYPWVTQSIISITVIPSMGRYVPGYDYGTNLGDANIKFYKVGQNIDRPQPHSQAKSPAWRNSGFIAAALGPEYAHLKKFLTYPYLLVELTTWTGSPLVLKPEAWQDADATVRELAAFVPPGQRIAVTPSKYNTDENANNPDGFDDGGEYLDVATFLDNFPTMPVVNNMALGYLASNKNGLQFAYDSADWSQQRAMGGANAARDVAGSSIGNTARQSAIANTLQQTQTATQQSAQGQNAILTGMSQVAFGGGKGGGFDPLGPLHGLIGSAQAMNSLQAASDMSNNAISGRGAATESNIRTAGEIRDTNYDFASFAAQGDYQNAIAGVTARVQDARMIQPSTSGQFGGDSFNIINNQFGYSLKWKMVNRDALRRIGNFWLRYGYAVQQFSKLPDDFMCMSKFTYWKLQETYISQGAFPEMFKQTIRGIFEKGVTVWRTPDDIGNISLSDNTPIEGITL